MPIEEEHRTGPEPETSAQTQPETPAPEVAPSAIEPQSVPEVVQPEPTPESEPAPVQKQPSVEPAPEAAQPEPTPPEPEPQTAPKAQPAPEAQPTAEGQPAAEAQPGTDQAARPARRGVPPPKDPEIVGYICDAMLGRLARELRMRGLDVFYQRNLGGMMAFRQSRLSGRTLLTRNNRLKGLPGVVMMESTNIREQVAQVTGQPVEPAPEPVTPEPGVPAEASSPARPGSANCAATGGQPEPQEPRAPAEQPQAERPAPERSEQRPQQQRERRPEQRREPRQQSRPEPRPQPQAQAQPRPDQEPAFGRCLACNTPLEQISRDTARPSIPFFIYQIHHDFRRCPKCKKVLWPGSHVQDMERRVRPAGRFPRRGGRGRR